MLKGNQASYQKRTVVILAWIWLAVPTSAWTAASAVIVRSGNNIVILHNDGKGGKADKMKRERVDHRVRCKL